MKHVWHEELSDEQQIKMKTPEELAEEWVKDQLGMDYVRGLQSISAKDCHGMIETIMRECFVAGYEVGHSAGYDDGADALADYLEKLK